MIFLLNGQTADSRQIPPAAGEIDLHRVECLRHLRRTDDAVCACKNALRPLEREKKLARRAVETIRAQIHQHLEELDLLCLHPLLFHGEAMYDVVSRFKDKLSSFQDLLAQNAQEASGYYKRNLVKYFKQVGHAIFQETDRLLNASSGGQDRRNGQPVSGN